ncbi:MAG: hypothetical protein KDB35_03135 [Acidimicrobiales bacterium]|nr:hypothetical protein [Acidimicrobiales bacterium]
MGRRLARGVAVVRAGVAAAALATVSALVLTPALLVVPVIGVAPPAAAQGAADAREHQGEIFSFGITVPDEPVTVGDTIVFPNGSELPHTITDRGGTFDTGEIAPGTSGEVTFTVPGRYEIFCRINPSTMNAVVDVGEGGQASSVVRVQAYDEFREGESRRFDPAELEVEVGTTLTVANVGGLQHSLVAADGALSTGTIEPGAEQGRFAGTSAEVVADEAGTFEYFCEFFPDEMRGVLRVVDPSPPTTEAPATTVAGDDGGDGGETAAPAVTNDDGVGGLLAAGVVLLLGLGAVLVALVPRGRREPAPPTSF